MILNKQIKELTGFNHQWYFILAVLFTGISFPFVFLFNDISLYVDGLFFACVFGVITALILCGGNLLIFYYYKKRDHQRNKFDEQKLFGFNFFVHMVFTAITGFIFSFGPTIFEGEPIHKIVCMRFVVGALLYCCIFISVYYISYFFNAYKKSSQIQQRLRNENLQSQLNNLKNQVKPHFLFNSLNTLSSLIPEEPDEAVEYVQHLSRVYRYILEINEKKLIPINEELACIKSYMFMLKIRFGDKLQFELNENEFIAADHIVPLSLQMLIENAVKHNIVSFKKPLLIQIKRGRNDNILVKNNLQLKTVKEASTGTGLNNIRKRYDLLGGKKPEIIQTAAEYIVSLPLFNVN